MQSRKLIQEIIVVSGPDVEGIAKLVANSCQRCRLSYAIRNDSETADGSPILHIDTEFKESAPPFKNRRWIAADLGPGQRVAAFGRGYIRVISGHPSDNELDCQLKTLHGELAGAFLVSGIGEFSDTLANELAGPLHYMSLGLRAMSQELRHLKPLFDDLHKAWFTSDHELLEKLRLILSVVNLQQSWSDLDRTMLDYETGLSRLRDIQNFLRLGSQHDQDKIRQISLNELVRTCLNLLAEGRSDGIKTHIDVPIGLFCRFPAGPIFFGTLKILAAMLEILLLYGSGRGCLLVRGQATDDHCLELLIEAKPEPSPDNNFMALPKLDWARFILEDLGIRIHRHIQEAAILVTVQIPKDRGDSD